MKKAHSRLVAASMVVSSALFIANCSRSSPSAPSPATAPSGSQSVVGATTTSTPEVGRIKVCVTGGGSGTFSVSATPVSGGTASVQNPATVASGVCTIVAEDFDAVGGVGSNVTTTQTSPAFQSVTGEQVTAGGGTASFAASNGGALFLNNFHGYTLTFTVPAPPPPTGTEGCSPGYFKNHSDSPAGYDRTQTLDSVLSTNVFASSLTIEEALSLKGGGVNALARHAAAAILNAAALPGSYTYTLAQLRAIFDQIEGGTLTIDAASDLLASKEDVDGIVCPLN